ncbi:MAG: MBL fold metallo-hydrolase [Desulfobacterales bacterium]|nr:MBL fold metallo-hydrolase [Desulfobacterales bacterium]
MIIKCWGSRGSIPVSGKEYVKYGGDTTCLEIRTRSGDLIIVDAGTGIRRLGNELIKENRHIFNVLFTHAHWDHLMGFPFFKPLYYRNTRIRMHRCPFPSRYVESILSKVMYPPNFPVRYSDLKADIIYEKSCPTCFQIGSVTIFPIPLSHPNKGSGYKFVEDGKTFIFLTDNELGYIHPGGLGFKDYLEYCKDAELLIHDAEYTPEEYKSNIEWGHTVFTDALELAFQANVKKLGLFHLNQERTDIQADEMLANCNKIIDETGSSLECVMVGEGTTFEL